MNRRGDREGLAAAGKPWPRSSAAGQVVRGMVLFAVGLAWIAGANADPLVSAIAKKKPDWPAAKRSEMAEAIGQYGSKFGIDPVLIFTVAYEEEARGEPAKDRRWVYDFEAIHQNKPPSSVVVPGPWDDLTMLTQALSQDLQDYEKRGGKKLALQAYYFGHRGVEESAGLSTQDSEFLGEALKLYSELSEAAGTQGTEGGANPAGRPANAGNIRAEPKFSEWKDIYSKWIRFYNRHVSPEKAQSIAEHLLVYSVAQGVDTRLVFAVIAAESNFEPYAISRKGAQGLGQLMPATSNGLGVRDVFDVEENIMATTFVLKDLQSRYELRLVLAAYNAGEGAVKKYNGIPPYAETRAYVNRVMRIYNRMQGKKSGGSDS